MLALFVLNFAWHLAPALHEPLTSDLCMAAVSASTPWLTWAVVLTVLDRFSGGGHPPTEPGELSPAASLDRDRDAGFLCRAVHADPWMTY